MCTVGCTLGKSFHKKPTSPPLTINVSSLSTHALKQSFLFCHHGSPPVPDQVFSDYQDGNSLGKTEQRRSCFSGGEGGSVTEALILNFFFLFVLHISPFSSPLANGRMCKQGPWMWSSFPSGEAQAPGGDCRLE